MSVLAGLHRSLTPPEHVLLVRLARGSGGPVREWGLDWIALRGLLDLGLVGRVAGSRALVVVTADGVDVAEEIAPEREED